MSTLSILVEGSACSWGKMVSVYGEVSIADVIRAIVSFANSHLSMSANNKVLLFMYAHAIRKRLLFNSQLSPTADHSASMVAALRTSLRENAESDDLSMSSPLAGALSHAICHMKANDDTAATTGDQGFIDATTSSNTTTNTSTFINGRVVILSMTTDFGSEHGPLMNIFFSAAKHGICVDVASLGETSPLMQQAADITNGQFIQIPQPKVLLRYLMTSLLAPPTSRALFPQPTLKSVDYRASCSCHHQLVSSGWVCSVCLSVLCQFVPICKVCGAVFKVTALLAAKKNLKRKRKE